MNRVIFSVCVAILLVPVVGAQISGRVESRGYGPPLQRYDPNLTLIAAQEPNAGDVYYWPTTTTGSTFTTTAFTRDLMAEPNLTDFLDYLDPNLTGFAAVNWVADDVPYSTGGGAWAAITWGSGLAFSAGTASFAPTELEALTYGGGAGASIKWIWNLTAGDPNMIFGNDAISLMATTTHLGADGDIGNLEVHHAGTVKLWDSGDDTSVIIGPVGDGTTVLGITGTINPTVLQESGNAVPNATDHLGFFAATTSAQLYGIVSDETGSASGSPLAVFSVSPTLTGTPNIGTTAAGGNLNVVATEGSNIVTNGTFTTDLTGWAGANWAQSAGTALHTAGATTALTQAAAVVVSGTTYKLTFDVVGGTTGTITPSFGGFTGAARNFGSASYVRYGTATSTTALSFTPTSAFDGAFDNVQFVALTDATGDLTAYGDLTGPVLKNLNGDWIIAIQGQNHAVGIGALASITTGISNTASGYQALYSLTSGSTNTASGYRALKSLTTGNSNTASGYLALYSLTTGISNTASGYQALYSLTTGSTNTASGVNALYSLTTGSSNTASGYQALNSLTTGISNTASGYRALNSLTTGSSNTASGYQALYSLTSGSTNTASGVNALYALVPTYGARITAFSDYSGTVPGTVRATAASHGLPGGDTVIEIAGTTNYDGIYTATKIDATYFYFTDTFVATETGSFSSNAYRNTALGNSSGYRLTTGTNNVFVGVNAGNHASQLVTAENSIAIGANAFTTASNQVVLGDNNITQTLLRGSVGVNNTAPATKLDQAQFSADALGSGHTFSKSRGTGSTQTIVQDNDNIGFLNFAPSDGVDFGTIGASIEGEVDDAAPAASSIGGALVFKTAPGLAADDLTERVRIDRAGMMTVKSFASTGIVTKVTADSPYTPLATDYLIRYNTTAGSSIVAPADATGSGRILVIKKTDTSGNTLTISPAGGSTVDGAASQVIATQYDSIMIMDVAVDTYDILN